VFGDDCAYSDEAASIFAGHFHRLGYLPIERRLDEDEWQSLETTWAGIEDTDLRLSELRPDLPDPTLIVGKRVLCYAPPAADRGCVFFDFWEKTESQYQPGKGSFGPSPHRDDPLLRDIRTPAATFDEGLILTLYGKVLRWGSGWWIHHPRASGDKSPSGVREQLIEIQERDPSQSLAPRRP
jgi:hypothetical protein